MKRTAVLLAAIMACSFCQGQINEKDTIITTVNSKNGSIAFQAEILPDFIQLQWNKGPHEYTGWFELYRSPDGVAYNIIKQFQPTVAGADDNDFEFKDEDPLRGKNYYRLIAYDKFSGEKKIVELVAEYKNAPRKLYPSLLERDGQFYINNYDGQELSLWVYNSAGNPVVQRRIINSSTVFIPEVISGGAYIYQLVDKKQMIVSRGKFVLQ
jgi:hypothetical protein